MKCRSNCVGYKKAIIGDGCVIEKETKS